MDAFEESGVISWQEHLSQHENDSIVAQRGNILRGRVDMEASGMDSSSGGCKRGVI